MVQLDVENANKESTPLLENVDTPSILRQKEDSGLRSGKIRFLVLLCACLSCVGDYFTQDLPQTLQTYYVDALKMGNKEYNIIFSIYSFPNIILPFVGGIIINRVGLRVAYAGYALIIVIGQAITSYAAAKLDFGLLIAGQVVYAIGGDSIIVAKSAMISKWFLGKELSFALGAGLCVARLGSSLDSFIAPKIMDSTKNLLYPNLVGTGLCIFSLIAVLILNYVDRKVDQQENNQETQVEKLTFKDLKKFNLVYYLLLINCGCLYSGYYGLVQNLNNMMSVRFGFSTNDAGNVIPIIYFIPVLLISFLGLFADKVGKRVLIVLMACTLLFVLHFVIAFFPDSPEGEPDYYFIGVLVGLGLFYSAYAAVYWPCIALTAGEKLLGVGYGGAFAVQNGFLVVVPIVLGWIHDGSLHKKGGYFWTEITLAGIVAVGIIVTAIVYFLDKGGSRILDKPSKTKDSVKSRAESVIERCSH